MRLLYNPADKRFWCLVWIFFSAAALFFLLVTCAQANTGEDEKKYEKVIAMYEDYAKSFPDVKDIDSKNALQLVSSSDVIFIDVRKDKEQEVSMVPGAITKEHFMKNLEQYRNKRVIAYCTIGYRSGKFAEKMEKKGVTVTNLQAGLLGWVHAHGPLVHGNNPTESLHVYGKTWDLAPSWITAVY